MSYHESEIWVTTDGERFYDYYTAWLHQNLLNEFIPLNQHLFGLTNNK